MIRVTLAALVLLSACASNGGATPASGPLTESEWVLVNENYSEGAPTITFADNRASGYAGCNRWFAEVSLSGLSLSFSAIGTTRMMCAPPSMETERAFTSALESTRGYHIENGELALHDSEGAVLARFSRTN